MTILLTNEAWTKMEDGRMLFDVQKESIWDRSQGAMDWRTEKDIPDDVVYDAIGGRFNFVWRTFKENLRQVLGSDYLVLVGSIGRWDGRHRFAVRIKDDFNAIREYLKDCDYITVEEDDQGKLFLTGSHHDGTNSAEIRILTEAGYNAMEEDDGFDPDAEGMTETFGYIKRFGKPSLLSTVSYSWLWKVIEDLDETGDWDFDDADDAFEYYRDEISKVVDKDKTGIVVSDVARGVTRERDCQSLVAISGGLNGPGKWPDYLEALRTISLRFNARIVHMEVDDLDDIFYVAFSIWDAPDSAPGTVE